MKKIIFLFLLILVQGNSAIAGKNFCKILAMKGKFLLIENNAAQALHLKGLLEAQGLQVTWASGGQAGIKAAQQLRPNLIVLDAQMPAINGFEVCQALQDRRDTADIPIIVLTRHDDPKAMALSLLEGVIDYIPKDAFADAMLLETLRYVGLLASHAVRV